MDGFQSGSHPCHRLHVLHFSHLHICFHNAVGSRSMFSVLLQVQQLRVDAINAQRQQQWQAACDVIASKRAAAQESKAAAETLLAAPRTQQAAERAEAAFKAALIEVQDAEALQVSLLLTFRRLYCSFQTLRTPNSRMSHFDPADASPCQPSRDLSHRICNHIFQYKMLHQPSEPTPCLCTGNSSYTCEQNWALVLILFTKLKTISCTRF